MVSTTRFAEFVVEEFELPGSIIPSSLAGHMPHGGIVL